MLKKMSSCMLTGVLFFLSKIYPKRKVDLKGIDKILVIRRGAIGDVVMTTPLLQEINIHFPQAKVDFLVEAWASEVLTHHPCVNQLYILDQMKHPIKQLRREKYDLIFLLDLGIKNALFAKLLGPKILSGIDAFHRGFLFDYKMKRFPEDQVHERDSFLGTLEAMGLKTKTKTTHIELSLAEKEFAATFWEKNQLNDRKVIGLFPGGGANPRTHMPLKRWGEEKYSALSRLLIQSGYQVLLFGAAGDKPICEMIKSDGLIDLSGKYSLRHSAALIQRCQAFVANDSGLMHISAAVGTPTIAIFGPTNPKLLKPWGERHFAFFTEEHCSPNPAKTCAKNCHPCYRQLIGDFNAKCKTKECLEKIDPQAVFIKVQELLCGF